MEGSRLQRINVVGTSASGKSTLSKKIAEKLQLNYIELDNLFWLDDWQQCPDTEFLNRIQHSIDKSPQGWVIDGNYTRSTMVKWKTVETVVWLDLPFHLNLYQSIWRTLQRLISRKALWYGSNNVERMSTLFSRDSIIWWMIKTHHKNRKKYLRLMNDPQYNHIQFVRLSSRREMNKFLESI